MFAFVFWRKTKNINLTGECLGGFGGRKKYYQNSLYEKNKLKNNRNSSLGETKWIWRKNREVSVLSERILIDMQAI